MAAFFSVSQVYCVHKNKNLKIIDTNKTLWQYLLKKFPGGTEMKAKTLTKIAVLLTVTVFSLGASTEKGCGGSKGVQKKRPPKITPTKYPIILAHGFAGFKEIAGIEYFFGVADYLRKYGFTVFVTQVDMFNTIEVRGNQLADQILEILNETGAEKVNIIGHSMGGLDARYAITHRGLGDVVASLVTISTPHHGTSIADVALGLMDGPVEDAVSIISWLAGCTVDGVDYDTCQQDAIDAAWNLTIEYVENQFNPQTPNDERVAYFSYAGITGLHSKDIVDPLLIIPYGIVYSNEGDNDGLCSVESAKWGTFLGTVEADHLDEIGQLVGVTGLFNYKKFYLNIGRFLAAQGF